jgi:hypothetical protein
VTKYVTSDFELRRRSGSFIIHIALTWRTEQKTSCGIRLNDQSMGVTRSDVADRSFTLCHSCFKQVQFDLTGQTYARGSEAKKRLYREINETEIAQGVSVLDR